MLSLELCRCSSDLFLLSSRPRIGLLATTRLNSILLGMIESRSVNNLFSLNNVQYTNNGSLTYILLFTQALTRVWFDVTIIDIKTILLQ